MLHRMVRQIEVSGNRFRCVFVVFLYVAKMFSERSPSRLPVSPIYNFLQLIDRLGPDNFSTLQMKGHAYALHRVRANLKVPGCSHV